MSILWLWARRFGCLVSPLVSIICCDYRLGGEGLGGEAVPWTGFWRDDAERRAREESGQRPDALFAPPYRIMACRLE